MNIHTMVTFTSHWSLKCLFSKEEDNIIPMTLCPVDTGPLTLRTNTLSMPALQKV